VSRQFHRTVVAFEDEVSTESGSDRVIVLAISIIAIGFYPVATALGTDVMKQAPPALSKLKALFDGD